MYRSPNGTIRSILNGTVFREPILLQGFPRPVPGWKRKIVIGRHAFADQYMAKDVRVRKGDRVRLVHEGPDGKVKDDMAVREFTSDGVAMAMFNERQVRADPVSERDFQELI